jgi:hypothetical protein
VIVTWFDVVRQVGIVAGGIGAIVFPIYYWTTAPGWRRSEMGRFLMLGGIGWASLYLAGIVGVLLPSELVQNIIRVVLIVGAGSFAWYQVFLYRRVRQQELARRKEREENDATQE